MAVYRDLVYSNIESFISSNFPVIRTLYDDAAWSTFTHEFFREHLCHSPLFPQFAREFLRWLEERQQQGRGDPPWLLELAHYEWAELALSLDEATIEDVVHDPAGDPLAGIPIVSPLACVLGYHYSVHLIGPAFRPAEMSTEPTWILLVRGRDDDVRFHEINALSAMLIERLRENTDLTGPAARAAIVRSDPRYPRRVTTRSRELGRRTISRSSFQRKLDCVGRMPKRTAELARRARRRSGA